MRIPLPVLTAQDAAAMIKDGQTVSFSAFTPAGSAKATPRAIAERAKTEHAAGRPYQIRVLTGAAGGESLDGALASANAISFRAPWQSDKTLRALINSRQVPYLDMHLSTVQQAIRYGFLGPVNWAVIEACDVTAGGGIVLTASVGASNTFANQAEKVLIELNRRHPPTMLGLHDLFEPQDPPNRREINVYRVSDRIGSPILMVPPEKIAGIVETNLADEVCPMESGDSKGAAIGRHVAEFFCADMRAGRIPKRFLPLQSGIGAIANAVLKALGEMPEIPHFEMYSEVLQDAVIDLIQAGRCTFASATALTITPERLDQITGNIAFFRRHLILRPQEISNNPEIIRRLGVISINTALEVDLFGNVNSTHLMGTQLMNGIGGSGDFTRNAYISIFTCPSVRKNGKISTIVPLVTHLDHSEHSVQVVVTEWGAADLRGKDKSERARLIINNCAHPDYRAKLQSYVDTAQKGHSPESLTNAFAMHRQFLKTGDMRGSR
jgi:propionyl-CoA:succinyl-CoA transferase